MSPQKQKIIIDTDIGTNTDDLLALVSAVRSQNFEITGITTVLQDASFRARLARRLCAILGEDIPVYAGSDQTLLRNRPVTDRPIFDHFSEIPELQEKFPASPASAHESRHAADFLIDSILEHPGEITLVTIGPLTNPALAVIKCPAIIPKIKEIVLMGSVTHLNSFREKLPPLEYNVSSDPEAASVLFSSRIKLKIFGLDAGYQTMFSEKELQILEKDRRALNRGIARIGRQWMDFRGQKSLFLCDPLTIAFLLEPSLFHLEPFETTVSYTQDHPSGRTEARPDPESPHRLCLGLQTKKVVSLIMDLLLS